MIVNPYVCKHWLNLRKKLTWKTKHVLHLNKTCSRIWLPRDYISKEGLRRCVRSKAREKLRRAFPVIYSHLPSFFLLLIFSHNPACISDSPFFFCSSPKCSSSSYISVSSVGNYQCSKSTLSLWCTKQTLKKNRLESSTSMESGIIEFLELGGTFKGHIVHLLVSSCLATGKAWGVYQNQSNFMADIPIKVSHIHPPRGNHRSQGSQVRKGYCARLVSLLQEARQHCSPSRLLKPQEILQQGARQPKREAGNNLI